MSKRIIRWKKKDGEKQKDECRQILEKEVCYSKVCWFLMMMERESAGLEGCVYVCVLKS